ncbi:isochorismatase family protein [Kitasatospora sp. NPDC057015]|uniref:isochorismatase family protein n=1 Tax=Kitasatospora sp. NPDC057015 TaxID=3346001 RepID=UPI00362F12DF
MEVEAARSALVLVDLMDRIVALPLRPRSGDQVLATSLELAGRFRAAGATVAAIRVERPGVAEQPPGSGLAAGVAAAADLVVVKRTIGGFHGTDLDERLRGRGVDTLVFAGIATNMGVESTARAAADHGYELVFVEDAMATFTGEEHRAAIGFGLPRFGTVVTAAGVRLG